MPRVKGECKEQMMNRKPGEVGKGQIRKTSTNKAEEMILYTRAIKRHCGKLNRAVIQSNFFFRKIHL